MIQLGNLVTDIKDIDPVWAFSYYCKVPAEQFNGSTIKIKSIFKPEEKTPSFCIYFKEDQPPKFKDFSTNHFGDYINLVQQKFNLNYSQTCFKIMADYTKWAIDNKQFEKTTVTVRNNYKVVGFNVRLWSINDKDFFLPFHIGSTLLKWGLVKPLGGYKMQNGTSDIVITGNHLYGYFTAKGELYKIYQPNNSECKFINVKNDYNIGSDHKEGNKYFGILSSWKDALSFQSMGLKIDLKVPPSENSYFTKKYIMELKEEYKSGFTLLDNDDAGIKAMLHYKKEFGLNYVCLPLSKDVSDSMRDHGKHKVRNLVVPLIHKALN